MLVKAKDVAPGPRPTKRLKPDDAETCSWLEKIKNDVKDLLEEDKYKWKETKWTTFVAQVALELGKKDRDDDDITASIAGLIQCGIRERTDLRSISNNKKDYLSNALEAKGVPLAIACFLYDIYVTGDGALQNQSGPEDDHLTPSSAGSLTGKIDLKENPAIQEYLSRAVDPIRIPEKTTPYQQHGTMTKNYPPLVLDGASGTGKTQQAFAMLKKEKCIIYFVMCGYPPGRGQPIYEQINRASGWSHQSFLRTCKAFVEQELKQAEQIRMDDGEMNTYDPLSVDGLSRCLDDGRLDDILLLMAKATLQYDGPSHSISVGLPLVAKQDKTPLEITARKSLTLFFADKILFIDEALSRGNTQEERQNSILQLKFVRNLGRMLQMKVVAAGTSAVFSNMLSSSTEVNDLSRQNPTKSFAWAVCEFLWKPVRKGSLSDESQEKLKSLLGTEDDADLEEVLRTHRPLVIHQLLDAVSDGSRGRKSVLDCLRKLEGASFTSKGLGMDANVGRLIIWLMGVWLDQERMPTSHFSLMPPDMVRGHYFEPAMMSLEGGFPHTKGGVGKFSALSHPLTATIYNISQNDCDSSENGVSPWLLSAESPADEERGPLASVSIEFEPVRRALSFCVQQCLWREPLLAIALSEPHRRVVLGADPKRFRKYVARSFQESEAELSLGALGGEHLELVVFAALQLANGKDMASPLGLHSFCVRLFELLTIHPEEYISIKEDVARGFGVSKVFSAGHERDLVPPCKYGNSEAENHFKHAQNGIPENKIEPTKESEAKLAALMTNTQGNDKKAKMQQVPSEKKVPGNHTHEVVNVVATLKEKVNVEVIPWLVPAHSPPNASSSIYCSMFKDMKLAALVPGSCNASQDIAAFPWPLPKVEKQEQDGLTQGVLEKKPHSPSAQPAWTFEVKGRSNSSYSMKQATKDLMRKCRDTTTEEHGLHHAMLVAISGSEKSEWCIWGMRKRGKLYLRVVLLVSGV